MVEKDYNFNDPVEVTSIFREQIKTEEGIETEEFSAKCCFLWENVVGIEEYAHPDNWVKYPGAKVFVHLQPLGTKLLLGDYQNMKNYFRMYRRACPTFIRPGEKSVWNGE